MKLLYDRTHRYLLAISVTPLRPYLVLNLIALLYNLETEVLKTDLIICVKEGNKRQKRGTFYF